MAIHVTRQTFPDRLAILPSHTYLFENSPGTDPLALRIAGRKVFQNGIEVIAANVGLLALNFKNHPLGPFEKLEARGNGPIPAEVTENQANMINLQIARLQMAVFVTACIYGTHAATNHTSLRDPLFPDLTDIYSWSEASEGLQMPIGDYEKMQALLSPRREAIRKGPTSQYAINGQSLVDGMNLADRLLVDAAKYEVADPQSLLVMTYESMILHQRQHAGASLALAAVVAEVAIKDIMHAFGFVEGGNGRIAPVRSTAVSKTKFKGMNSQSMLATLKNSSVIDSHLFGHLDALRLRRNGLMHKGQRVTPRESGEALTTVRDILRLCTGERDFELNTGWSYRS
jgi:hypothetical protein